MKSKRISWSKFAAVEDSCPTKLKCIANHKHPTTNYELDEIMRWDEASLWYPRHLLEISARSCLDVTCTLVFRSMEGGHVTPLHAHRPPCVPIWCCSERGSWLHDFPEDTTWFQMPKTPFTWNNSVHRLHYHVTFFCVLKPPKLMPRQDTQKPQNLTQKTINK
jgi:hypothetical protein